MPGFLDSLCRLQVAAGLLVALVACGPGRDLDRGRAALERNDIDAARAAFQRVLDDRPDDPQALYGLGWTFHVSGRREEARMAFERCLGVAPDSPLGYKGLGSSALADGDLARAERWFAEAIARAPGDRAIRNSLALVHLKAGRTGEALDLYEALRREDASDPALALGHAEALVRAGRLEEALTAMEAAIDSKTAQERTRGLLHALRARVRVGLTAGRIDGSRCGATVPEVRRRLEEADRDLGIAAELGVPAEDLLPTRRLVARRHEEIRVACPGVEAGEATAPR
ncbi:MAG: tetratricopeptide repeat protein [Deltaproteobacteria bacterium]|nr:tetratricopeptide repeat protein [Deltaproteobacteria bacterium]